MALWFLRDLVAISIETDPIKGVSERNELDSDAECMPSLGFYWWVGCVALNF
jgi:hypothetical protein